MTEAGMLDAGPMRSPLNRGFSSDQPADDSPRFIAWDAPEPVGVMAVAILEQDPAVARWETSSTFPGFWVQCGSAAGARVWPVRWAEVGRCRAGTQHDMKDVTDWAECHPVAADAGRRPISAAFRPDNEKKGRV